MIAGFDTMAAADAALRYLAGSDPWFDSEDIPSLSGSVQTQTPDIGSSKILIGTGTSFLSDLTVGDLVEIDYQYSKIASVSSDTQASVEDSLLVSSDSGIVKLTQKQYDRRKALSRKKVIALQSAKIEISTFCDLPSEITEDIKTACAMRALEILKTGSLINRHEERRASGISSESMGDSSVQYSGFGRKFSPMISKILKPYIKSSISKLRITPSTEHDPNYLGSYFESPGFRNV